MVITTPRGILREEGHEDRPIYDICIEQFEYGTLATVWLDKPADTALSPFAASLSSLRQPQAVDLRINGDTDMRLRNVYVEEELGRFVLVSRRPDIFYDPEPRGLWPRLD